MAFPSSYALYLILFRIHIPVPKLLHFNASRARDVCQLSSWIVLTSLKDEMYVKKQLDGLLCG